ncbi:PAS domain S-box protein [Nocardioides sp. HDW12B]|uniref:ATP-binding protein n=1 Tax=Nocardioides sp. HDW12B TaxID=2714939 RepID=UPI0014094A82|nr:ATP-binding protein [Nocardioides sp. HDW12B]QIK66306.1 PAS domain S-box protein [Nocardioides sp. HDW12B]
MTDPSRDRSQELRRLRPHPSSVAEARHAVRAALRTSLPDPDLLDTAELCVSELVTNAVVHAGTEIDVAVVLYDGGARVEVLDRSAHLPVPRHYVSLASTGRGLLMVDQLCTRWGVSSRVNSKTVWFEVGGVSDLPDHDPTPMSGSSLLPIVPVVLRRVPLLLHAAWQIHAESLLREILLVRLDEESLSGLEEHASASAAIALMEQQIRRPDLGQAPEEVMAGAVEPLVSADEIVLEVPPGSVRHFAVLNRLLEDAAEMADSGSLLTPPIQPEIRDFRRWICQEVARQAAGDAPVTWDPSVRRGPPASAPPLRWDASVVQQSAEAVIAADDSGTVVAVSHAAATALGYPDPAALVGGRLIDVIPERFRQAHLAGVTLHLFAGRGPLIDTPVTVPALCADGHEVLVEVLVRSRALSHDRRLFTAHLTPA